jgi:deoxyxylulose-5-phosphate synthase
MDPLTALAAVSAAVNLVKKAVKTVDDVRSLGPVLGKYFDAKADAVKVLEEAKSLTGQGKPIAIMMHTLMGKGVDFMENDHGWHGIAPNDDQLAKALAQLPETMGDY